MNLERFLKVMARECIRRVFHGEPQAERIVGKNILRGSELICTKCHHYSSGCDVMEGAYIFGTQCTLWSTCTGDMAVGFLLRLDNDESRPAETRPASCIWASFPSYS